MVNTAADWVPASVPRPVAKGGVALVGGLIVFGLVQKVGWPRRAAAWCRWQLGVRAACLPACAATAHWAGRSPVQHLYRHPCR
jgi:hypothetical protein